jgi:predicted Zn-dependent protease
VVFLPQGTRLTEKDTIVLADFTNTTGDPVFDGTLRQGLSVQLEQSPFLSIISDQQIQQTLQMAGQKPDAKLTPGIARELCQRTASAAVLDGSIAQIGTQYLLILKAVNCSSGELLASTEAQASDKNHVLEALGKTASEIRNKLGESLTTVQKFDAPLEQVTTSSLEALKTFSLFVRAGGVIPGFPMLQHAIELDPNFALAYSGISDIYSDIGDTELASEYAQKAFDLRERVTERERLNITATYYFATLGDLDRELRVYPIWEQMYPRAAGPWINSSGTRELLGDYARALKEAQEAVRLAPYLYTCYVNVGSAFLSLNRRDEAKQIAQRALARGLDMPDFHLLLYRVAFLENDTKEMEARLAAFSGRSGADALKALFAQSATEAYFGRLRNSLGFSRRALETARRGKLNELAALVQDTDALREAEFGNVRDAKQAAAMVLALSSGRTAKLLTALALARAGDVTQAQALADELNRQFPSHTLMQRYWLPTIRGSIELARKNPSKALEALQGVSYEFGDTGLLAGNLYPVYVRGQAYLGTHQGKEAAAEFQKILDHRFIVLNSPLGALAYLGLARAYVLQGDTAKARGAYQDFLALWKDADPDIPILKQAKAEYRKLQ